MIKAFLVVNNHAMVRLCRFYEQLPTEKQTELCQTVYKIVTARPDHLCSFVDDEKTFGPDTKLVYRHFATLYFCILSDRSESELAMMDLIQVYVETLDRVFENVCELDLIFDTVRGITENLVILATRETLYRMWCAGEICTAVTCKKPIVPVACDDYEAPDDEALQKLPQVWTKEQTLAIHSGNQLRLTINLAEQGAAQSTLIFYEEAF